MSRIELAPEIADDLDRNPLIGRAVRADLREFVIGRSAHGYIALYRHVAEIDTMFILAIRVNRFRN